MLPYQPKILKRHFKQAGITRCNLLKKSSRTTPTPLPKRWVSGKAVPATRPSPVSANTCTHSC
ncbi:MAG: hypothetical protein ACLR1G_06095 [Alistipes indistinctus]